MRHRYGFATFPRAYSKSFLSVMALMCRCVLYPRCKLFVTSGGKEQAASILSSKVQEICTLIPAFAREIDWRRGKTQEGKDHCRYIFKNGKDWFITIYIFTSLIVVPLPWFYKLFKALYYFVSFLS